MSVTTLLLEPLQQALLITAFVAVMMLAVEYVSVVTQGAFQRALTRSRGIQYVAAVALGAVPGCLGAFTVVTLYAHRVVSLGAVVGAMIATSGDEAFVMLALFPSTALWLTVGLAAVGLAAAPVVDLLLARYRDREACTNLIVHPQDTCRCFPGWEIIEQWRSPRPIRAAFTIGILTFVVAVVAGVGGPAEWNWIRITLLLVGAFGVFVVSTVPDHFLHEHLWQHVTRTHVPRVFLWTFGVMVVLVITGTLVRLDTVLTQHPSAMLGMGALAGIIPESGPHLVFVTWFSQGKVPRSVLVANSIVQDGHGMLPLLADSRRDFVLVKSINLAVGLVVGAVLLLLGY